MNCQACGGCRYYVIDSRDTKKGRRRRYECICGARWSTLEVEATAYQELQEGRYENKKLIELTEERDRYKKTIHLIEEIISRGET